MLLAYHLKKSLDEVMSWDMATLALWQAFVEDYPFDILPDVLSAQVAWTVAATQSKTKPKFDKFLWFRNKPQDMRTFLMQQKRMQKRK